MKIAISVYGDPDKTSSPMTALAFAEAALSADHEVFRVFFYHDAVRTGCVSDGLSPSRIALLQGWVDLKQTHEIDLMVCIAAAESRGIYDTQQAKRLGKAVNLHPAFQAVGLGQFAEMIMTTDRTVTFDG